MVIIVQTGCREDTKVAIVFGYEAAKGLVSLVIGYEMGCPKDQGVGQLSLDVTIIVPIKSVIMQMETVGYVTEEIGSIVETVKAESLPNVGLDKLVANFCLSFKEIASFIGSKQVTTSGFESCFSIGRKMPLPAMPLCCLENLV